MTDRNEVGQRQYEGISLPTAYFLDYHHAVLGSAPGWDQEADWRGSVVPYALEQRRILAEHVRRRERACRSLFMAQPHIRAAGSELGIGN